MVQAIQSVGDGFSPGNAKQTGSRAAAGNEAFVFGSTPCCLSVPLPYP